MNKATIRTVFNFVFLSMLFGTVNVGAANAEPEPIGILASVTVDKIITIVNDDVITQNELDQEIKFISRQLRQQNTVIPPYDVLQKQILERMIQKRLQLQLAERGRIRIADETLDRTILKIASDNKLTLTQFRDVLTNDGFDFEAYRKNIREEITINRLRQRQVYNRVNVTEQETEDFLANQAIQGGLEDEFHIAHILIEVPEAATSEQVQQAKRKAQNALDKLNNGEDFTQMAAAVSDGQNALEGGDLGWRKMGQLPVLFSSVVATMNKNDVKGMIRSPSGFHIIKLIEKRSNEAKNIIKQTRTSHILIKTDQLLLDSEARVKLEQLKNRIEQGDDFSEIAKSNSDDKGSAAKGGSLGWVSPGDMVQEFEKVMNTIEAGKISQPFKTQFGWHIIRVEGHRNFDNTEKSKNLSAKNQIRQRKIEEETQNWIRRLRDEAYVEIRI